MPRFADWAKEKAPDISIPAVPELKFETFVLVNDYLKTDKKGIKYRKTRRMGDIHDSRSVPFGTQVTGIRMGKDGRWLKVGKLYLPMKVNRQPVLIKGTKEEVLRSLGKPRELRKLAGAADESVNVLEAQLRLYSQILSIHKGGQVPLTEADKKKIDRLCGELRCLGGQSSDEKRKQQMMMAKDFKQSSSASGTSQDGQREQNHDEGRAGEASADNSPALEPPKGALYRVCFKTLVVRFKPAENAPVIGKAQYGDVLELFEWDATRKWRKRIFEQPDFDDADHGWMMLDHPRLGPLIRPVGREDKKQPLEPMCMAASENFVSELQRFISEGSDVNVKDDDGKTPLMWAAERGNLDCIVCLLAGRADASLLSNRSETAFDLAVTAAAKALIILLSNPVAAFDLLQAVEDDEGKLFSASIELLQPKIQIEAKRLLARLVDEVPASYVQRQQELKRAMLAAREPEVLEAVDLEVISDREDFDEHEEPEVLEASEPEVLDAEDSDEDQTSSTSSWVGETLHEPPTQSTTEFFCMDAEDDGEPYEVVFPAVWVRAKPSRDSQQIVSRMQGQVINMYEKDATGEWRRVQVFKIEDAVEHKLNGWMKLHDKDFGPLLKPYEPPEDKAGEDGWY